MSVPNDQKTLRDHTSVAEIPGDADLAGPVDQTIAGRTPMADNPNATV